MQDVIFVAILTAFFALAVVFVKACERIIGPDVEAARAEPTRPRTGDERSRHDRHRKRHRARAERARRPRTSCTRSSFPEKL